jgi:hypothetical protein
VEVFFPPHATPVEPGQDPEPVVEIPAEVMILPEPEPARLAPPSSAEIAVRSRPYSRAVDSKKRSSVRMLTRASIRMSTACCSDEGLSGEAEFAVWAGMRIFVRRRPMKRT